MQTDDDIYREQLIALSKSPMNSGELKNAITHEDHNPLCGDRVTVYLEIKDKKIEQAKFMGKGCLISQVSTDLTIEEIKGKKIDQIQKMKREDVLELLGLDLSISRIKCAMLGLTTIKKALLKVK